MVLSLFKAHRLLVALTFALGGILAGGAYAQQTVAVSSTTRVGTSTSIFDSYKPYTDEPVANWKAANDTVAKIGGWREYAKQAQQLEATAANAGNPAAPAAKPAAKPTTQGKP